MTALATIETDAEAFERFLYTASCWPTKSHKPITPSHCLVSEDEVVVQGGGSSQGMVCYSTFQSDYFDGISVTDDEPVEAWYYVGDTEERIEVVDPLGSMELRGEDGQSARVHLTSKGDDLETEVPQAEARPLDVAGVFQDEEVTFHGKPAEISIKTTVSEVQKIIDVVDLHTVEAYPILVKDSEFLVDHPIGSRDADVMETDSDATLVWKELEAEVSGVDTLNFYGSGLKRAMHCLSRWIDDNAEIELHTSPYAAKPVGSQEGLAIVYRGNQLMLGYILPPVDPDESTYEWVV